MQKMKSIQEFSKLSGVEASTLRYWEEIGVFEPSERDPETNYRFYTDTQLIPLNFVTTLSDLEVPLKTIAQLREERNPHKMLELLDEMDAQIDKEMNALRLRYSIIHTRRELITHGITAIAGEIHVAHRPEHAIAMWPPNEYEDGDIYIEPLANFVSQSAYHHINLGYPIGGYYENIAGFLKSPLHPDNFFSMDPFGVDNIEAGPYLTGFVHGRYGELGDLPERMVEYAKEKSLNISGPVYLEYLFDEICVERPEQYLAQVSIKIKKKNK